MDAVYLNVRYNVIETSLCHFAFEHENRAGKAKAVFGSLTKSTGLRFDLEGPVRYGWNEMDISELGDV